jgi:hypothetical protein
MHSKSELKTIVFEHFCEVEYYKINKGFAKATLEELSRLYEQGFRLGYREALSDIDEKLTNLDEKLNKERK